MPVDSTIATKEFDDRLKERGLGQIEEGFLIVPMGYGGEIIDEMVPEPIYTASEKIRWKGGFNSFITLGKDRHASKYSGAGGVGETQCGMIDLVAGRVGSVLINNPEILKADPDNDKVASPLFVDNNWFADAARVYISQKCKNVDRYLGFNNDTHNVVDLSSVVIKSDCTRIVGRESVRIYTGSSKTGEGLGRDGELRANGTPIESPKIELIGGGNDKDLQPAILGNNLVAFLKDNNKILTDHFTLLLTDILTQLTALHFQVSVLSLGAGAGSAAKFGMDNLNGVMSNVSNQLNKRINDFNYLDEGIIKGQKSILSNKVYLT